MITPFEHVLLVGVDQYRGLPPLLGVGPDLEFWKEAAKRAGVAPENIQARQNLSFGEFDGLFHAFVRKLVDAQGNRPRGLGLMVFSGRGAPSQGSNPPELCLAEYPAGEPLGAEYFGQVLRHCGLTRPAGALPPLTLVFDCSAVAGNDGRVYRSVDQPTTAPLDRFTVGTWLNHQVLLFSPRFTRGTKREVRASIECPGEGGVVRGQATWEIGPYLFDLTPGDLHRMAPFEEVGASTHGFMDYEIWNGSTSLGRMVATGDAPTGCPVQPAHRAWWDWTGPPFPSQFKLQYNPSGSGNASINSLKFRDLPFLPPGSLPSSDGFTAHEIKLRNGELIGCLWNKEVNGQREQFWGADPDHVDQFGYFQERTEDLFFKEVKPTPTPKPTWRYRITTL